METLFQQLNNCNELIAKGDIGNIPWLNKFCATFLKFASEFKLHLPEVAPRYALDGVSNLHVETIFLCLTQVVTCITQLERIIHAEESTDGLGTYVITRQHFVDRINWCLRRLQDSLTQLTEDEATNELEDQTFVELMDLALDQLEGYREQTLNGTFSVSGASIGTLAQHIVRHTLAFANVCLEADQKALTTLCETLLGECQQFEENTEEQSPGERKLHSLSLERALYGLESFLNEALLRLIFASLKDVEEVSAKRLKSALREDDPLVDELINDFDLNIDRILQIGVFAIAFSPDIKTKTIVRSCLASLEILDSCIVPAFQLQKTANALQHADILEHHFNEELWIFRNVIHEIIDSRALINNYLDTLGECISNAEKILDPKRLQVVQMASVLHEHFQLGVNYDELCENGQRLHCDFELIWRECQAILQLDEPVEPKRIVKRLKILYSVLAKWRDVMDKTVQTSECVPKSDESVTKRQHSLVKSKRMTRVSQRLDDVFTNSLSNDSDLISFQLTEILRIN